MKLFKSKTTENSDVEIDAAEELEIVINGDKQKPEIVKATDSRIGALLRCLAGLLFAIALLFVSSFSFIDLLEGPKEADAIQNEETGAFVMRDVYAIIGTYGDEADDFSKGIVPMGSQFVTVQFSKRYLESAKAIAEQTTEYVDRILPALDLYVVVQGTVDELSQEQFQMLNQWFAENKEALVAKGMITDVDDPTVYISEKVLIVDTVNGKDQTLVFVTTGLAALSFAYVLAELVFLLLGGIKRRRGSNNKDEKNDEDSESDTPLSESNDEPEDKE